MKAIRKVEPGKGALYTDVPIPEITSGDEVLVKVKAAALCKSDVDVYEWTPLVRDLKLPLPITMGHEFMGEVVEIGRDVKGIAVGDHVVGETHVPCGYCYTCRTGNQHICTNNMGVLGRSFDGCFAEYIKIPVKSAIKMDPGIPFEHGAVMEPLGTALHALSKAEIGGKSIAILGCGAIGLMSIELARILGASKIFALSTTKDKLEKAAELGADVVINGKEEDLVEVVMQHTHGQGVDVAIEYTGNQKVINQMINIMKTAGTCVFVGMIDYPLTFENFMLKAVYKELILTGIFGRRMYETWETLNNLLEAGKINVSNYIGPKVPLERFEEAVALSASTVGRVILEIP